jgi:hypothetical protein
MFGFLKSASKPSPKVRRIGVDWGVETVIAVLLDEQGHPLDLRQMPTPSEDSGEHFEGLQDFLREWPLPESDMVISLTRDYHMATLDLSEVSAEAIAEKVAGQLDYDCDEARFAWWNLDSQRTVTVTYPQPLLLELAPVFATLATRSVHFEAVELAQARLLQTMGLPLGLLTVHRDLLQLSLISSSDFDTMTQSTAVLGIEQMLSLGLDRWRQRGQVPPVKLVTNLSPDYLERLSSLPCERLEEEAVAFHLALSPAGPHRFKLS